jgi:hypothetical protein
MVLRAIHEAASDRNLTDDEQTRFDDGVFVRDAAIAEGIEIEVLDLRSLRPLDRNAIVASVRRTRAGDLADQPIEVITPGVMLGLELKAAGVELVVRSSAPAPAKPAAD